MRQKRKGTERRKTNRDDFTFILESGEGVSCNGCVVQGDWSTRFCPERRSRLPPKCLVSYRGTLRVEVPARSLDGRRSPLDPWVCVVLSCSFRTGEPMKMLTWDVSFHGWVDGPSIDWSSSPWGRERVQEGMGYFYGWKTLSPLRRVSFRPTKHGEGGSIEALFKWIKPSLKGAIDLTCTSLVHWT